MMKRLMALSALVAAAGAVKAETEPMTYYLTGNELHEMCISTVTWQKSACMNYIVGAYDGQSSTHSIMTQIAADGIAAVLEMCVPLEVTRSQLRDVVAQHLAEHPETRHFTAASRVRKALNEAFPCE